MIQVGLAHEQKPSKPIDLATSEGDEAESSKAPKSRPFGAWKTRNVAAKPVLPPFSLRDWPASVRSSWRPEGSFTPRVAVIQATHLVGVAFGR
jgi:hypothetical protein